MALQDVRNQFAVRFAAVVQGVGVALEQEFADRGAKLEFEGAATVRGNETLLSQVLHNLIANAVKYSKRAAPCVHVGAETIGNECLITIRDNGIGIEEKYLAEIFRPLVRLHTASEYTGTGLGLTLARKAMQAQHGVIWCESTLGEGSTFFVRMPIAAGAAAAAQ